MSEKYCELCGGIALVGDICSECRSKRNANNIKNQIENGKINSTEFENDIFCPYCGEIYDDYDSEFYEDGEHEVSCQNCECNFLLETDVLYHFSTKRFDVENE